MRLQLPARYWVIRQNYLLRILGHGSRVINASEEMWQCFRQFRLRQP